MQNGLGDHYWRLGANSVPDEARRKKNRKKQSVSQTIDQVMRINSVQKSSKSELSSGTFGHFKVYYKKRPKTWFLCTNWSVSSIFQIQFNLRSEKMDQAFFWFIYFHFLSILMFIIYDFFFFFPLILRI